jgi:hypothetical protein
MKRLVSPKGEGWHRGVDCFLKLEKRKKKDIAPLGIKQSLFLMARTARNFGCCFE